MWCLLINSAENVFSRTPFFSHAKKERIERGVTTASLYVLGQWCSAFGPAG